MQPTAADHGRAKLARDVWWNVASLAVAGAFGILLNYLITLAYGASALGAFNQVFAVYLLFAQLAALGCHYSVLTHVAATRDRAERRAVATSGLVATATLGSGFSGLLWLLANPIGALLKSPEVAQGLRWAAPGILLYALSKVTLSCLNALPRMRWYAILFGGRFVAMVAAFAGCAAFRVDQAALPGILTASEALVFTASLGPVRSCVGRIPISVLRRWVVEHLRFGIKGFGSGILSELNTRVDVLVLGYFAADATVGAYSFAAILAEGMYQILVVLRTTFAPVVIRMLAGQEAESLREFVRRVRNRTYLTATAVGALSVAGYVLLVPLVTTDLAIATSWPYFAGLMAGMVASAGYAPFQPMLLYGSLPGWHTVMMVAIVSVNLVANLALVPTLGPVGAAVGTAIAFVAGVGLLRGMVNRLLAVGI